MTLTDNADPRVYRSRIVALPLQRSLLASIHDAGEVFGVTAPLGWLGPNGDLMLDDHAIESARGVLRSRLREGHGDRLHDVHRSDARRVVALATEAKRGASKLSAPEARSSLRALGSAIARIYRYGLLGKFVPDLILEVLRGEGDAGPLPLPAPSAGALLTRDLARLTRLCHEQGWTPERLTKDWPTVDTSIVSAVTTLSSAHVGHGPLAWDAPGYEDPDFVVEMIGRAFANVPRSQLPSFSDATAASNEDPAPPSEKARSLRRYLGYWLDFLERETWLTRRSFFVGVIPLLLRLERSQGRAGPTADDLLFLTFDELTGGMLDPTRIAERRKAYLADRPYLDRYGISPSRRLATYGS